VGLAEENSWWYSRVGPCMPVAGIPSWACGHAR
jgi:hypothetical protein